MERLDRVLLVHKERAAVSKSTVFIITAKESKGIRQNFCVCVCYVMCYFFFIKKKKYLWPLTSTRHYVSRPAAHLWPTTTFCIFLIGWLGSHVNKQLNILTLTGCRVEVWQQLGLVQFHSQTAAPKTKLCHLSSWTCRNHNAPAAAAAAADPSGWLGETWATATRCSETHQYNMQQRRLTRLAVSLPLRDVDMTPPKCVRPSWGEARGKSPATLFPCSGV